MNILTKDEFILRKRNDTLAIMGCGYSINTITDIEWIIIQDSFDQFGMNWYCNAQRDTTFYLIREQCVSPKKLENGSMIEDLERMINNINTTLIVKHKTGKADNYSHIDNLNKFNNDGIIVEERPGKCSAEDFKHDMFIDGMHHGKCTMYDALHFAIYMKYKRIIFFGIDLYDYRYFWLPYNKTRDIVLNEGYTCDSPHLAANNTINIIKQTKETYPEIKMFVHNPKSLLASFLPVWK